MSKKTQIIVENTVAPDFVVAYFRYPESGIESPKFMVNSKRARSYTNWTILMDGLEGNLEEKKETFLEAIKSTEIEIVLGKYKNSEIDGEILSKLIQLVMWVETITCEAPIEFCIKVEEVDSHVLGARKVSVTMN